MIKGMFYVDGNIDGTWNEELYAIEAVNALKAIRDFDEAIHIRFVSAVNGDSHAYALTEAYRKDNETNIVITNSSLVFSFNKFSWNPETNRYDLWFWKDDDNMEVGEFVRIDALTQKDLRWAHNIWKMWRNGALDIWRSWENDPEA